MIAAVRPSPPSRRRRPLLLVGALVIGASSLLAAGCGSSSPSSSSTSTTAPEEKVSSDADVAAGLQKLPALVAAAAATAATGQAGGTIEAIEDSWRTYEGTVREKEQDLYLTIEDGFASIQDAIDDQDPTKAAAAVKSIDDAATEYLSKHPA